MEFGIHEPVDTCLYGTRKIISELEEWL
jgi:hypothetical protein